MKRVPALFTLIVICLICVTSLSAQSIWKEPKNPSWKTATGAEAYERLMWKAVKDKDWLAVESHMASNFVFSDAGGVKDKAQRLAELKTISASDLAMSDPMVTPSGEHAVVTYTMGKSRIMSVWQQQKSGWVLVAMAVSN